MAQPMGDGMADLSLSQAARLTGRSKSTIGRAIKSGRLSATRNEDGTFGINPAELLRAFPKGGSEPGMDGVDEPSRNPLHGTSGTGLEPDEIRALREELTKAQQRAAAAEAKAEERAAAADERADTIADLRARLDREGEERRKLTAILTDQKSSTPGQVRPFWRRFFS